MSQADNTAMMSLRTRAQALDQADPLARWRDEFWIPQKADGQPQVYLCGNSLGLQPKRLEQEMAVELKAWRELGVAGHFEGPYPWMRYHEALREPLAALVGAEPSEVVAMNSLTVNLHLMMVSFYRPEGRRRQIVIEKQAFPSDRYAVESQIRFHGLDPDDCLVELDSRPHPEDGCVPVEQYLAEHGEEVALLMYPGVQYATGEVYDLSRLAALARAAGANVGFDLAHAVGNVPLALHQSGADFAVWCSYKYLNSGAGAVAGCFVHQQHAGRTDLPRFNGWWGHDPDSRFRMGPDFKPGPGADAWQLSNPPIYGLAPVRVSLQLFMEAGLGGLREKSLALSGFLAEALQEHLADAIEIITPLAAARRGSQLSLRVRQGRDTGRAWFEALEARGIIGDWREPDIIRVAPVPLYNRFEDCAELVMALRQLADGDTA